MSKKANQPQEHTDIEDRKYDTTIERPPRMDLRRDHAPVRDPELQSEKIQKRKDLGGTSVYQKKPESMKTSKKQEDEELTPQNRNLDGFTPKKENLMSLLKIEAKLDVCLKYLSQAMHDFYALKSIDISPDGKLGGRGFITEIPDVRARLYASVENISGIIDTIYDETRGEHWNFENHDKQIAMNQVEQPGEDLQETGDFQKVSSILNLVQKVAKKNQK